MQGRPFFETQFISSPCSSERRYRQGNEIYLQEEFVRDFYAYTLNCWEVMLSHPLQPPCYLPRGHSTLSCSMNVIYYIAERGKFRTLKNDENHSDFPTFANIFGGWIYYRIFNMRYCENYGAVGGFAASLFVYFSFQLLQHKQNTCELIHTPMLLGQLVINIMFQFKRNVNFSISLCNMLSSHFYS